VQRMLAGTRRNPDEVVGLIPPLLEPATVRGYVRDTREKVSQAVSVLKTIGCKFGLLCQLLLKFGGELIGCPKKVLRSHTQNPLILQA
jgi:hypothetical protein